MLQRGASNAHSWGWATQIRTKQSKWLEENILDMEDKVKETLKIIQNDGDSFAQRVEMYYKKRPELVTLVEEALRAHRELAERYDQISKQLQNANHTIATVCPDQVQYYMEEDDEKCKPEMAFSSSDGNKEMPPRPNKVPSVSKKDFKSLSMTFSRKGQRKTNPSFASPCNSEEIDTLQKEISSLQKEKEFVKGVHEHAQEKFLEIESRITEMHGRIYGTVIEDNVGANLMETAALRSCQDTLCKLPEKQADLSKEGQVEYQRLKEAYEKFETLRDEFMSKYMNNQEFEDQHKSDISESPMDEISSREEEKQDPESPLEKIDSNNSLTVIEMAEKIDVLLNKVIALETAFTSQKASVDSSKSEAEELHSKIRTLEADKEMLTIEEVEKLKIKIRELEEELQRLNNLNQTVRNKNRSLQTEFDEPSTSLVHPSERVKNLKPDEEEVDAVSFKKRTPKEEEQKDSDSESLKDDYTEKKQKEYDGAEVMSFSSGKEENASDLSKSQNFTYDRGQEDLDESVSSRDMELHALGTEDQLYRSGLDGREKILLEEYASVLRNYKEVRVKLNEVEKKNMANIFELSSQLRELTGSLAARDKEMDLLHQKMNILGNCPNEENIEIMNEAANSKESSNGVQKSFAEPSAESREESGSSNGKNEKSCRRKGSDKKISELSPLERKLRTDIDDLLEEELEFWLRFRKSVHQIQKFETFIHELRAEILKVRDKIRRGNSKQWTAQSEVRPICRHMREIQTELALWLEQNAVLEDELEGRLSTLNNIQYEITSHFNGRIDKAELSDYQAAKFLGEVLNMKQENKKIAEELHTGLDNVKELNAEVNDVLIKLEEEFGVGSQSQMVNSSNRIPLRSFLFGVKLKRKAASKSSKFSRGKDEHNH